jgi:hypothetical protein
MLRFFQSDPKKHEKVVALRRRVSEAELLEGVIEARDLDDDNWDRAARLALCVEDLRSGISENRLARIYGEEILAEAHRKSTDSVHRDTTVVPVPYSIYASSVPPESVELEVCRVDWPIGHYDERLLNWLGLSDGVCLHSTYRTIDNNAQVVGRIRAYHIEGDAGDWWVIGDTAPGTQLQNNYVHEKLVAVTIAACLRLRASPNRIVSIGNEDILTGSTVGFREVGKYELRDAPAAILNLAANSTNLSRRFSTGLFYVDEIGIASLVKLVAPVLDTSGWHQFAKHVQLALSRKVNW